MYTILLLFYLFISIGSDTDSFKLTKYLYYLVNSKPFKFIYYEAKDFEDNRNRIVNKEKSMELEEYERLRELLS